MLITQKKKNGSSNSSLFSWSDGVDRSKQGTLGFLRRPDDNEHKPNITSNVEFQRDFKSK